jgi:hypothetical protein
MEASELQATNSVSDQATSRHETEVPTDAARQRDSGELEKAKAKEQEIIRDVERRVARAYEERLQVATMRTQKLEIQLIQQEQSLRSSSQEIEGLRGKLNVALAAMGLLHTDSLAVARIIDGYSRARKQDLVSRSYLSTFSRLQLTERDVAQMPFQRYIWPSIPTGSEPVYGCQHAPLGGKAALNGNGGTIEKASSCENAAGSQLQTSLASGTRTVELGTICRDIENR